MQDSLLNLTVAELQINLQQASCKREKSLLTPFEKGSRKNTRCLYTQSVFFRLNFIVTF